MSTDISLVSIAFQKIDPDPKKAPRPYVVDELLELGFSTFRDTLKMHADDGEFIVWDQDTSTPGLIRYYVPDPLSLASNIEANHANGWDWDGLNYPEEVVRALREHPQHTWWFHVDF